MLLREGEVPARTDAGDTLQYTTASSLLLQSVEELKQSSVELQHYAQRLERVEARCKKLEDAAATRAEVQRIAGENKALYVGTAAAADPGRQAGHTN